MFRGKNIVLGITGGIAAYKSADLVSRLRKKGAQVYCVMTQAAQEFITPLTLRTLSENPVFCEMFTESRLTNVEHVGLADKADLLIIAPATANIIGKLSNGIADDLLTSVALATRARVLIAPAMNVNMYHHPAVQENIARLKARGCFFIEPEEGMLACGYTGKGRLAEPEKIVGLAGELLSAEKPLSGKKVLVTAGPTYEPLDPVRFIANHSSGKMGYALAKQACLLGAEVILVSGPTALAKPEGIRTIDVRTALEMRDAVFKVYDECDIVIKAAAVADYRPKVQAAQKIKKNVENLFIELEKNPDILAELGAKKKKQVLVGFAAETQDLLLYAADKVVRKNLDFIAANDVTQP
ncbi:MAG: bifunctional phosphopantothenoylcysteine decarboxylase/phosphopantothenate--cysteine ligase CoaBC, partial [Clostridia bacterium]|nr:bifunctional phosphopantothenoylcysteine decarboxylase/phosphopantothenate--cysteine ligase CoaBC [Clostridia bacterium]